jgi:hypothetical protein
VNGQFAGWWAGEEEFPVPEELKVLIDIARRLGRAQIPYMVTGSMAMSLYARPRMTRDIDIVVLMSDRDIDLLVAALDQVYYLEPASIRLALRGRPRMFNVIHEEHVVKVDLILRPDTEYARMAFERRRPFDLSGQKVWAITPEDLILAKLDWARGSHSEIQLNDVRALLRGEGLDMAYIEKWSYDLEPDSVSGDGTVVKDTDPKMEMIYEQMLWARSAAERLHMVSSMHATAKALVMASIREQYPSASTAQMRGLLFLRFYGDDFSPDERAKIYLHLAGNPH